LFLLRLLLFLFTSLRLFLIIFFFIISPIFDYFSYCRHYFHYYFLIISLMPADYYAIFLFTPLFFFLLMPTILFFIISLTMMLDAHAFLHWCAMIFSILFALWYDISIIDADTFDDMIFCWCWCAADDFSCVAMLMLMPLYYAFYHYFFIYYLFIAWSFVFHLMLLSFSYDAWYRFSAYYEHYCWFCRAICATIFIFHFDTLRWCLRFFRYACFRDAITFTIIVLLYWYFWLFSIFRWDYRCALFTDMLFYYFLHISFSLSFSYFHLS